MTKLELKSSHEVIDTVNVADVESIFYCKPTDPDILTVLMKDGKRLYCDEVCPINSLQEEPVSGLDNGDMPIERWKQAVEAASHQRNYRSSKGLTETKDDYFVDGVQWADEHPKEEPVSEDLGEYINELSKQFPEVSFAKLSRIAVRVAKWQKEHLWKSADGDDLPEIDREVVVFTQNFPNDAGIMCVAIAHRPNPDGWDGKSLSTGKVEHYTPKTYDKGGWNIPNIVYWLDVKLPKEIEL